MRNKYFVEGPCITESFLHIYIRAPSIKQSNIKVAPCTDFNVSVHVKLEGQFKSNDTMLSPPGGNNNSP